MVQNFWRLLGGVHFLNFFQFLAVACVFALGPFSFFIVCMVRQKQGVMTDIYSPSFPMGGDSCDYVGPSWDSSIPSHLKTLARQIILVRYDAIVTSSGDWVWISLGDSIILFLTTHLQHDQVMKQKQSLLFWSFDFLHSVD